MAKLAVISHHALFAAAIAMTLRGCPRVRLLGCWRSLGEAEGALAEEPDAVLFLVGRPPEPGEEERRTAHRVWPHARMAALSIESNLAWPVAWPVEEPRDDGGLLPPPAPAATIPLSGCDLGALLLGDACPGQRRADCPPA